MKNILIILSLLHFQAKAQQLETIYINEQVSTHFVTSEPIQYVDISTKHVVGDLPVENILRVKPDYSSHEKNGDQGVVTIVCEKYMVQYRLCHARAEDATKSKFISAMDGKGLLLSETGLSTEEMKSFCKQVLKAPGKKALEKSASGKIRMELHGVYLFGDYYFMDMSIINRSAIPFTIDQVRFKLVDKNILKSTNYQEIELEPEFSFYHQNLVRNTYRNVFVFKRFTFPNQKVFSIEVPEEQLSGRRATMEIDYRKILNAEPL